MTDWWRVPGGYTVGEAVTYWLTYGLSGAMPTR